MKNIIALEGIGGSGKTSTLKIVINKFREVSSSSLASAQKTGKDQREIFNVNDKKVGIETQGDPNSRLETSLELFTSEGCDLIICATRTYGGTVKIVEKLSPPYEISWRGQSFVQRSKLQHESNAAIAELIFKEGLTYL